MTDITERLRKGTATADRTEAADLIDQLRAELATKSQPQTSVLQRLESEIEAALRGQK